MSEADGRGGDDEKRDIHVSQCSNMSRYRCCRIRTEAPMMSPDRGSWQ